MEERSGRSIIERERERDVPLSSSLYMMKDFVFRIFWAILARILWGCEAWSAEINSVSEVENSGKWEARSRFRMRGRRRL